MSGTISVRGTGSVPTRPDEAVVTIELSSLKRSREDAYRDVAERSQTLEALCDELDVERARRTTSGVSVAEYFEWEKNKNVSKGFRATTRLLVRLEDPEVVARLLEQAVARTQARVDGPWWRIKPSNPAHLEARRLAALDARAKAEAIAEALGVTLRAIERVAEPGAEGWRVPVRPPGVPLPAMATATADVAAQAPVIELEPGEQVVEAVVDVSFTVDDA